MRQQESLEFRLGMTFWGWKRVLPKVGYLAVHCRAVQRPFMTFGIVPITVIDIKKVASPK